MLNLALRDYRRSSGLTQQELAVKAELSIPTVRHLENGRGTLDSLRQALTALQVKVSGRNLPPGPSFGAQFAELRRRRGLNQRQLALMVDITQPTLVSFEKRSKGRLDVLERIAGALGAGLVLLPRDAPLPFYSGAANASVVHNWRTPQDLLERLYQVFGIFDLDPCSPTHDRTSAPVRARVYFTEADDGLSLPWTGTVFLNPPYGRALPLWIAKARGEVALCHATTTVALVPARTDTSWWHNHIAQHADVFFLKGRLRFGESAQSAPFPSALVLWGAGVEIIEVLKQKLPAFWHQPRSP